jgi:quercetin dioxygenase-like cupin family protein
MKLQLRRFGRLFLWLVLVVALSAVWIGHAQQSGTPAGQDNTFTGKSWRLDSKGVSLSRRGFEAAARSDWHTHGGAQLLFVQEGRLRYQMQGGKVNEVGLHENAYLAGGVPHWHGAVPGQGLTQVSVVFGEGIKWMDKVTDEQYSGKATR